MTTLASAVSIGDNQIVIDAPLAAGQVPGFVKIGTELLDVGGADNRLGTTLVLSRPATATHSQGATVTYAGRPYDADFLAATAGAGGGGGVTLDNTVDPPAEVTTIIAPGAVIAGDEATLPVPAVIYYDDADPGAVGAGAVWIRRDDAAAMQATFVRSDDDTSWLTTGFAVYGDGFDQPATKYIRLDPSDDTIEMTSGTMTVLVDASGGISITSEAGASATITADEVSLTSPDSQTSLVVNDDAVALMVAGVAGTTFMPTGLAFSGEGGPELRVGTDDPSAGAGVGAPLGSEYTRISGGAATKWLKVGAADTAWEQVTTA